MKLDRLRYFNDEISKDTIIAGLIEKFEIFYFFKDKFYLLNEDEVSQELATLLEKTRKRKECWRESSSKRTYFFSEEFDAAVVADFFSSPKKETQEYIQLALLNCARHAINAFRAAHDTLTELLNRHSLEMVLSSIIASPTRISGADLAISRQVAVLAFDIDHFKQVNDTHGHLYGDIVLKIFARRIELLVSQLTSDENIAGKAQFHVSRPGGEEFAVVVDGILSDTEICDLAEKFRDEIAKTELPTSEEWQQYDDQGLTSGLTFPPSRERRITCSVGVINTSLPVSGVNQKQLITNMLNRADLALYKAKSSGRNRVCFFAEIAKRYGRVLEVSPETGVVVIDLGGEVGIKNGQEFFVFNPKFDGSTDYVHQDGRTSKRMGTYPRFHSARIEAFDVQKEISFCHVLEENIKLTAILKDAWLEAIPLGSIGHLIKSPAGVGLVSLKIAGGPQSTEILKQRIQELEKQHPFCAVFKIANEDTVVNELGSASINKILADLYSALCRAFPASVLIGYLQSAQFALVIPSSNANYIETIKKVLLEIESHYGEKIRVVSGIFDPKTAEEDNKLWHNSQVNYAKALELASLLALIAENSKDKNQFVFDRKSLRLISTDLENVVGREQALEDLKSLSVFGIETAWFGNAMSRLAYINGDHDFALEAIIKAAKLPDVQPLHIANMGILYYVNKREIDAYDAFNRAIELKEDEIPLSYYRALIICANKARIAGAIIDIAKILKFIGITFEHPNETFFGTTEEVKDIETQLLTLSS